MPYERLLHRAALLALPVLLILGPLLISRTAPEPPAREPATIKEPVTHTIDSRLAQFGAAARDRLAPHFKSAGVSYPPENVVLVGLKRERRLELFARGPGNTDPVFVKSYPFAAWTGTLGPKLREGDRQIPEGVYDITYLNPNSIAHVSLRIGYPNRFERDRGAEDGRDDLGGDIMIHGFTWGSQGCVVLEDEEVEEVFTLAADIGIRNVRVILAPMDARHAPLWPDPSDPPWTGELYARIADALRELPAGEVPEGRRAAAR